MVLSDVVRDDPDVADLVGLPTIGALAVQDRLTLALTGEGPESGLERALLGFELFLIVDPFGQFIEAGLTDSVHGAVARVLAFCVEGLSDALGPRRHGVNGLRVRLGSGVLHLCHAGLLDELVGEVDDLLDDVVGHLERVDHLRLGELLGARFHHRDGVAVTSDHEVEGRIRAQRRVFREGDELAVDHADAGGTEGGLKGQAREADCGEGADHRGDVGVVLAVVAEGLGHHLDLLHVTISEHRSDRPIDEAHGEDLFGRRTPFTLEEASGDLTCRLSLLTVVAGQGEEAGHAEWLSVADRCEGAGASDRAGHATLRLSGHLAG